MTEGLKGKVAKGAFWSLLEQFGVQGLNFLMGVILARLLTPDDYGTVAIVIVFITIAQVLVNSGLGQALVQKKEIDALDIDSVFYLSSGIALVLYGIIFFAAPSIARFYHIPELTSITRVLAISLLLCAVNSVQNAELFRQMRFNVAFRVAMVTTGTAALVGIGLAFLGYGVWALVWSSVLGSVAGVIARAVFIAWRPHWQFSWTRIRPLFGYGSKMMATSLITAVMGNLYGVIIGKCYSRADLAYVNRGRNVPDLLLNNVNASLVEVSLPALVQLQDDSDRLVRAMRRLMAVSTFVVFPGMLLLAAVSREFVCFFYGEKWAACIVYMQITCVLMAFGPIGAVNQQGLLAVGRSDVYLKVGILRNVLAAIALFVGLVYMNVFSWVLMNALLFGPISAGIDVVCGSRYLGYRVKDQIRDFAPGFAVGFAVALVVFLVNAGLHCVSPVCLFPILTCEAVLSLAALVVLSVVFRMAGAREIVSLLRSRMGPACRWIVWLDGKLGGSPL